MATDQSPIVNALPALPALCIHDVEVDGRLVDVLVSDGRIVRIVGIDAAAGASAARRIDGRGAVLLPGLNDHHVHLLAMAASLDSLDLSSTADSFADALAAADRRLPPRTWLRVVGYYESMAGAIDAAALDRVVPDRPVRVQHRSGAMWVLNRAALRHLPVGLLPAGAERDADGRPTGRFHRCDGWLREHLPQRQVPDLRAVGRMLAERGVTGVTDMTPFDRMADLELLADARRDGALPQHVAVSGGPALASAPIPSPLLSGPVKIVVDEDVLPDFDDLVSWIVTAHQVGRGAAVHCVTRTELAFAIAAFDEAGATRDDRIEHGALTPPELRTEMARLGLTVVTQPAFIYARGDQYLTDVEAADTPHLWPCATLLRDGVPTGGSTDAPFGPADPWLAIEVASTRRTRQGNVVGIDEHVDAATALALFLGPLIRPGGAARRVAVGQPADLCLLDRPLTDVLASPREVVVRQTWVGGRPLLSDPGCP